MWRLHVPLFAAGVLMMTALPGAMSPVHAQAGPPLLTDDPGTPGNRNWEINTALTGERTPGAAEYETPLLDINYGVGERIQLKYEVAYLSVHEAGAATEHGLSNSLLGVKWRFYDDEKSGLTISTYPQLELNNPTDARRRGLVERGPAVLLPVEINQDFGTWSLGAEAGHWLSSHHEDRTLLGLALTHTITSRLELLGEFYSVWEDHGRASTLDIGGRYTLRPGMLLLFMAGHDLGDTLPDDGPRWVGYLGLQFQIDHEN